MYSGHFLYFCLFFHQRCGKERLVRRLYNKLSVAMQKKWDMKANCFILKHFGTRWRWFPTTCSIGERDLILRRATAFSTVWAYLPFLSFFFGGSLPWKLRIEMFSFNFQFGRVSKTSSFQYRIRGQVKLLFADFWRSVRKVYTLLYFNFLALAGS